MTSDSGLDQGGLSGEKEKQIVIEETKWIGWGCEEDGGIWDDF